ncbi:DUF3187 family protein [Geothrix fuzhouensis]|uniref:DUF3187 family protein n=1 Tax=Geothrix fuzhouensis TaxID=2966451 RepID=UPI002149050F|nr:DUF3187 family protein [Geothrix fuzhouensis]
MLPLIGQEPMEMGPFPTREMFPLYLMPMVYQPVDPTPVGQGRWRVSLDHMQANTFEFSDILKDQAPRDAQGRLAITREFVLAHAAEYSSIPLMFFFDEEIARTSLRVRFGLTDKTDVWAELPFQSQGGGYLDGVIEAFHNLGFEQFGRDRVKKDQITLMVMTNGHLVFYSDQPIRGKTQDPTIGLTHELSSGPTWRLSAYMSLKPPMTTTYDIYRSGWDHSLGLTGRWQPNTHHVFYGGLGFIRRPGGSAAYNTMAFGSLRDAWGAHSTWEYRRWHKVRPFLQLYLQSGFLPKQPYQKLDRPSLQHDLGFHWQIKKDVVFTFRYLNNITHNENTADMGFGASLTASF